MPRFTSYFNIPYFSVGEIYSATFDRRRMRIIDNEMSFIANLVGDGVIDKWNISDIGNQQIGVSYGAGIVSGFVIFTYGEIIADIIDNKRNYIWLRRRGIIGDKGPFSPMSSLVYIDSTSPTTPASAPVVSNISFDQITISWTATSAIDFKEYILYRSDDGMTYSPISTQIALEYVDKDVNPDTSYSYKYKVSDVNGNISGFSPILSTATTTDTTIPPEPANVDIIAGNSQIELIWDAPISSVNGYIILEQPLDSEGQNDGSSTEYSLSSSVFHYTIESLVNGRRYKITLYSVSEAGVRSTGIDLYGSPAFDYGPGNISNVVITSYAIDSSANVAADILWDINEDPYAVAPAYYLVIIRRGIETSESSIYTETSITVTQYTVAGKVVKLKEDTRYDITIKTVDADGNVGVGTTSRFRIKKFSKPAIPTALVFDAEYTNISAKMNINWVNSVSQFSYNLLTIKRVNIDPDDINYNVSTTLLNSVNIGRSQYYNLAKSSVLNKSRYDITIIAVDHDGNQSDSLIDSYVIFNRFNVDSTGAGAVITGGGDRPGVPTSQDGLAGDNQITILWSRYPSDFVTEYNIYRADFDPETQPSDFSLVATVPYTSLRWTDYDVENGSRYFYFVTVKDARNLESLIPIDDDYAAYTYITIMPKGYSDLSQPSSISLVASGNNAVLSWEISNEDFDGFEIYGSIGNTYSFKRIGDAQTDNTSFTDINALKLNGTYYYMSRKYRNEGDVIVTQNDIAPIDAIPLGVVTMVNGVITDIDESIRTVIKNLEEHVRRETIAQLALPHHPYVNQFDDRRIRLSDSILVTDWTTEDFITYTTNTDLSSTDTYHVFLNDEESNYNTYINKDDNQLIFEAPIYDDNGTAPIVSVIFDNIGEVSSTLSYKQVEDLSGVLVTKGKISTNRLKNIDHFGRFKEQCLPQKIELKYENGFRFDGTILNSYTIYDIIVVGSTLVAATSNGIYSNTNGDWEFRFLTPSPANIIYYSETYSWYIAVFCNTIYYSDDLETWTPFDGLNGINIIRDICEDDAGNIFCSTDAGVHRINPTQYIKLIWEQTSLINVVANESYALLFHAFTLFASGEDGLYESTDAGVIWTKTTDSSITGPLYSLIFDNGYYFASSSTNVWRKSDVDFDFDIVYTSSCYVRKLSIFQDTLYVTTDKKTLKSNSSSDIYLDTHLDLITGFSSLHRNNKFPSTLALKVQGSRLYLGNDNKIYSIDSVGKIFSHANFSGACPTFFVNGIERSVGVFYSSSGVHFDSHLLPSDLVEVVTDYNKVYASNGGWVDTKYDAQIFIHLNNVLKATGKPSNFAKDIAPVITAITLTSFNARNSNFNTALAILTKIVQLADQIDTLEDSAIVTPEQIVLAFDLISQFNANIHPELRTNLNLPPISGVLKEIPASLVDTIGSFSISLNSLGNSIGTFDAVNGYIVIETFGLDKYDNILISVRGVGITSVGKYTHNEIEDKFESYNAGLNASFGMVQESNILKLLIDGRRGFGYLFPNMTVEEFAALSISEVAALLANYPTEDLAELLNGEVILPNDNGWYDTFKSTIDYELEIEDTPLRNELFYPASIIEVDDEVWVCGLGNIIAINQNTFETRKVFAGEFYIYNLFINSTTDTVYAIAEDGLYLIDVVSGNITKDVDIDLPDGFNSIIVINDIKIIGTTVGVYVKRSYETKWRKVVDIKDSKINSNEQFTFVVGKQSTDTSNVQVFYSTSNGGVWNQSSTFTDIIIASVAKRYNSIYYATDSGLYVQDIGKLFVDTGDTGSTTQLVDLLDDIDASGLLRINDVYADNDRVIAVDSNGIYYIIDGGVVTTTESVLQGSHKVRLYGGKFWIFGHDLIQIEGADDIVQLSSGKAIK